MKAPTRPDGWRAKGWTVLFRDARHGFPQPTALFVDRLRGQLTGCDAHGWRDVRDPEALAVYPWSEELRAAVLACRCWGAGTCDSCAGRERTSSGSAWITGSFERPEGAAFVHLVRCPSDPQRPGASEAEGRGWNRQRKSWAKEPGPYHEERLRQALADGRERTFNDLAVMGYHVTADVLFGSVVDQALWALVDDQVLEHTTHGPLRFRLRELPTAELLGVLGIPRQPLRRRGNGAAEIAFDEEGDYFCDVCGTRGVHGYDATPCPDHHCRWSVFVCAACGGHERALDLVEEHLSECLFARAWPRVWDRAARALTADVSPESAPKATRTPKVQLSLFSV